jgi:hypothetical protein
MPFRYRHFPHEGPNMSDGLGSDGYRTANVKRLGEINESLVSEAAKLNARFSSTLQTLGKEWSGFFETRVQEHVQLLEALRDSKSLPEVQQAYARFWQNTFAVYGEQAQRVMRITQGAADDASQTVRESVERTTAGGRAHAA